ncbi:thioredoxin family protein [Dictyobacter kobayashii]|uniref:Thiol reductase thioredoxin n=1 Tax=Dictyobacter kobayashii TaxID=2014872 RepID=A0A402AWD9_9CHLR|nr:thioredoxin family protein [Dictyobacter kobayashii]GCE23394.1 thiol reductase thioredoxin [Dictyobacter kobayashii]
MSDFSLRLVILLLVCLLVSIAVWAGRMLVARRRQQALAAAPLTVPSSQSEDQHQVRILAFSSEDCRQCHTLQQPALDRLLKQHGEHVAVINVDATTQHDLTERYKVLTVPTTVVLDAQGNAHAVNYGFANTQRLQEQVNTILNLAVS